MTTQTTQTIRTSTPTTSFTILSTNTNPSIIASYTEGAYELVPQDYYFSNPKQAALLCGACYSVDKGVRNEVIQVGRGGARRRSPVVQWGWALHAGG